MKNKLSTILFVLIVLILISGYMTYYCFSKYKNGLSAKPAMMTASDCKFRSSSSKKRWGRVYGYLNNDDKLMSFSTIEMERFYKNHKRLQNYIIESHNCEVGNVYPVWIYPDSSIHQRIVTNQGTIPYTAVNDKENSIFFIKISLVLIVLLVLTLRYRIFSVADN